MVTGLIRRYGWWMLVDSTLFRDVFCCSWYISIYIYSLDNCEFKYSEISRVLRHVPIGRWRNGGLHGFRGGHVQIESPHRPFVWKSDWVASHSPALAGKAQEHEFGRHWLNLEESWEKQEGGTLWRSHFYAVFCVFWTFQWIFCDIFSRIYIYILLVLGVILEFVYFVLSIDILQQVGKECLRP